ncbi:MAG: TRAP transporter substrate-binding protein [Rhizobiales bacterium]|nr:TRAP transporter substrate-binding protein [Hyphomicrobiales bacterium]NRB14770.1 TRAP transporter substrate-binding protein [Hyphomicrobiales bacterium]
MNKFKMAVSALAIVAVTGTANAAEILIKFSHVVAENTPKGIMANKFAELIEQRLAGKVKVQVFPNGQLFSDQKVLEAMLLGDVQLAAPSLSKFGKYTSVLQVYDLPFLFKDIDAVGRFQAGPEGQAMLKSLESKGLLGLGYMHNGLKQLSANNALLKPSDAKGNKFRIMSSNVLVAQFESVGAVPLKKPYAEVFTLLQTRAIDGQENTWSNIYSKKFFEVQDHITNSNHGLLDYMVVTSSEFWESLPDDIRPVVKTALDEAILIGNDVARDKAQSDMQKIIDSGRTTVHTLTDEQRAMWVEAMKPVWAEFADEIGQDIIDAAVASNIE